ncbi:MAG: hypothetical protein M4579_005017 [Chaenotheca gracillima]|nr:MAG: hypothetical protein M4579_005017 [Chaenotheca gracillima]
MKLVFGISKPSILRSFPNVRLVRQCGYSSSAHHDPLRILFCGSDAFSSESLRALYEKHREKPELISSIDVVCRPGKRTGRGLKVVREVPIKGIAQELTLPVHEIDTFTGWEPPVPYSLVIAVSFGLLVPPRILSAAQYGGLNVHPSLLPDFRGGAPLHHTLLAGRRHTGVTLQTLHPNRFDHGEIVSQTPSGGIDIPNPDTCTVRDLEHLLAPIGAKMLVQSIEGASFLPPFASKTTNELDKETRSDRPLLAPKITKEDTHIHWGSWGREEILRRQRILGPLWNMAGVNEANQAGEQTKSIRVVLYGLKSSDLLPSVPVSEIQNQDPGTPILLPATESTPAKVVVWTVDRQILEIKQIIVEGRPINDAARAVKKARLVSIEPPDQETLGNQSDIPLTAPRPWH